MSHASLKKNTSNQRYELVDQGQLVAFAEYALAGNTVKFTHTEVVTGHEGKGYGSTLAKLALNAVRAEKMQVIPACPFIAGYIQKHAEYETLIDRENVHDR
ncbi:MAG: GNAT family N-acetyltransferase [Noviherbaspirillum sp.]